MESVFSSRAKEELSGLLRQTFSTFRDLFRQLKNFKKRLD
jgi:hypothetical protein